MYTDKDFIQSIEEHQKIIHRVCSIYMDEPQDRKDLFQEITLAAWKGFRNFKGDAKFSTWLYRVALNTAITFYRKELRQPPVTRLPDQLNVAEHTHPEEEQLRALHYSINELSPVDKALVMLYMDDYSYIEIGELMGITANNVAVKMNRIKTKLKESSRKYL